MPANFDVGSIPVTFVPDEASVRTALGWSRAAKAVGHVYSGKNIGQSFAKQYAQKNGAAVMVWNDGRFRIIVANGDGEPVVIRGDNHF
jgi:hypothetical protein